MWRARSLLVVCSLLPACGADPDAASPSSPGFDEAGAFAVGSTTFTLEDTTRGRTLQVELWYPASEAARAAAAAGHPISELAPPDQRDAYASLLAAAPPGCPTTTAHAARDAEPADGTFPVVVFSHCLNCTRFSALTVAERLASHGFAVAAPDHTDNTLWDSLDGTSVGLDLGFLPVRAGDASAVLDALLDPGGAALPAALRGRFDGGRAGMMGHSFGAITTGRVLEDDARFLAGLAMAAPFAPGVDLAAVAEPALFLVAREDNSIGELGNGLMRSNYAELTGPAWKLEVEDAGHWSFSDLCGVIDGFMPGCGVDTRQTTPGEEFTYLPADRGRALAASVAAGFFAHTLLGDARGEPSLLEARAGVSVETR